MSEISVVIKLGRGKVLDHGSKNDNNKEKHGNDSKQQHHDDETTSSTYRPPVPFLQHLKSKNINASYDDILEIFKQVKINIPLLETIKQGPLYPKFLKDLCTIKRCHNVRKRDFLVKQVSTLFHSEIFLKCKDVGCPTTLFMIDQFIIEKAQLDLDASVNLQLYLIYKQVGLGELKPIPITLNQLTDQRDILKRH